jgi:T-complex protein 1 subunit alpha
MPTNVSIVGERNQGQDVRAVNGNFVHHITFRINGIHCLVQAVQAIANIVKSSLGPQGLDKMLVDDIGDVVITNDGIFNALRVLKVRFRCHHLETTGG